MAGRIKAEVLAAMLEMLNAGKTRADLRERFCWTKSQLESRFSAARAKLGHDLPGEGSRAFGVKLRTNLAAASNHARNAAARASAQRQREAETMRRLVGKTRCACGLWTQPDGSCIDCPRSPAVKAERLTARKDRNAPCWNID